MLNIRPAILKDIPDIEKIYQELFATMADLQPDYYLKASQHREFIKEMIQSKEAALLVAELNGVNLGFLIVQQQKTPPYSCIATHSFAYIIDFAVTEASRGLGLGTKLMEAAIHWAKSRDLDYVELGVLSNNIAAKKLYDKLGFEDATNIMRYSLKR